MSDVRYYLRVWGIKGESTAPGHVGDSDVSTWSISNLEGRNVTTGFGVHVPHQEFGGWISTSGRDFGVLHITKKKDSASDLIFQACLAATNLETVILYCEKVPDKGSSYTYYTIPLHNAIVNSFDRYADPSGGEMTMFSFKPEEALIKPLRH